MFVAGLQRVCILLKVAEKLSMKGRIFMSQRVIDVTLTVSAEVDVLVFGLSDEESDGYMVNLNSAVSQNEFKKVFSKLLQLLLEEDLTLKLVIAEGYGKGLYKDVCKEYIDDLNRELAQVKESLKKEIA